MQSHCPVGTGDGVPFGPGSRSGLVQSPVPFGSVRLSVPTPNRLTPFCIWPLTRTSPVTPVPEAAMNVQCA